MNLENAARGRRNRHIPGASGASSFPFQFHCTLCADPKDLFCCQLYHTLISEGLVWGIYACGQCPERNDSPPHSLIEAAATFCEVTLLVLAERLSPVLASNGSSNRTGAPSSAVILEVSHGMGYIQPEWGTASTVSRDYATKDNKATMHTPSVTQRDGTPPPTVPLSLGAGVAREAAFVPYFRLPSLPKQPPSEQHAAAIANIAAPHRQAAAPRCGCRRKLAGWPPDCQPRAPRVRRGVRERRLAQSLLPRTVAPPIPWGRGRRWRRRWWSGMMKC